VQRFLTGAKVVKVARRAKDLLIELDSKYSLVIHLKMTGQLVFVGGSDKKIGDEGLEIGEGQHKKNSQFSHLTSQIPERFGAGHPSDSLICELPDKSTRVIFTFADGSKLFFNDQRKFGWVRLMPTAEVVNLVPHHTYPQG
jgi:formamidopyrimidine-DNA glycosylase